ncbi:MCP four helix bundle domain-containing protein [Caproiciproducens sp. R2]|uniref:MCP four helix bundle domain-containing protein n=1 Tax=Caproiciproducens sp. R2 TaxID=3435187 RepID=UPI004033DE15
MFRNMKIAKKLMIALIAVAIISSISGIVGVNTTALLNATYGKALTDYGFSQGEIGLFNTQFNESRSILSNIIYSTEPQKIQESGNELDQSGKKLDTYLKNIKKGMVTVN